MERMEYGIYLLGKSEPLGWISTALDKQAVV